jgi:hypothetical protein
MFGDFPRAIDHQIDFAGETPHITFVVGGDEYTIYITDCPIF